MKMYCVNDRARSNGEHEVHEDDCRFLPRSRTLLGEHENYRSALAHARTIYPKVTGCTTCCRNANES